MSCSSSRRSYEKQLPAEYNDEIDDDDDVRTSRSHALQELAREPARWKLPKVRDYCSSGRRDVRGRSVSKSVFTPFSPLLSSRSRAETRASKPQILERRRRRWIRPRKRYRSCCGLGYLGRPQTNRSCSVDDDVGRHALPNTNTFRRPFSGVPR